MHNFVLFVALAFFSGSAMLQAAEVTCYNDDSQDVVNQDELRLPTWGGPAPIPAPADCAQGPAVVFGGHDAYQPTQVVVQGRVAYDSSFDHPVEARVAPTGVVAILTERGALHVYSNGLLKTWYDGRIRGVREFRMSRAGGLIAAGTDGSLIVRGDSQGTIHTVERLYASASGKLVALMSEGAVVSPEGTLYDGHVDGAGMVKVAADGTVVWLTRGGKIGSTKNPRLFHGVDEAASMKVNPAGRVAYLTQDGRLGRDGRFLGDFVARYTQYKIHPDGAVSARDTDGRARYFLP